MIPPGTLFPKEWDESFLRFQERVARWIGPRLRRAAGWSVRVGVGWVLPFGLHVSMFWSVVWVAGLLMFGLRMLEEWHAIPLQAVLPALLSVGGAGWLAWRGRWQQRVTAGWHSAGWTLLYVAATLKVGAVLGKLVLAVQLSDARAHGIPLSLESYRSAEEAPGNIAPELEAWLTRFSRSWTGSVPRSEEFTAAREGAETAATPSLRRDTQQRLEALMFRYRPYFRAVEHDLPTALSGGTFYIQAGTADFAKAPFLRYMSGGVLGVWEEIAALRCVALHAALQGDRKRAWQAVRTQVRLANLLGSGSGGDGFIGHAYLRQAGATATGIMQVLSVPSIPGPVITELRSAFDRAWRANHYREEVAYMMDFCRAFERGERHPDLPPLTTADRAWEVVREWGGVPDIEQAAILRENKRLVILLDRSLDSAIRTRTSLGRVHRSLLEYEIDSKVRWKMVMTSSAVLGAARVNGVLPKGLADLQRGALPAAYNEDPYGTGLLRYQVFPGGTGFTVSSVGSGGDGLDAGAKPIELSLPWRRGTPQR